MDTLKDLLKILKEEEKFLEDFKNSKEIDGKLTLSFRIYGRPNYVELNLSDHRNKFNKEIIEHIEKEILHTKNRILEEKIQYDKDVKIMKEIESELKNFKG